MPGTTSISERESERSTGQVCLRASPPIALTLIGISGFYIDAAFFPQPRGTPSDQLTPRDQRLKLAPFSGKPACQYISVAAGTARGVCADAYVARQTKLVPDVGAYPGHIACDAQTQSEIVCPLILDGGAEAGRAVGVLDLDCLALGGFDELDRAGLERIAELVVRACDW